MPDRYDSVRRREHSSTPDVRIRYRRDTDAFTAGAQYALDALLGHTQSFNGPINTLAADILANVHKGNL